MFESDWWPCVGHSTYLYKHVSGDKEGAFDDDAVSLDARYYTESRRWAISLKILQALVVLGIVYGSFFAGKSYEKWHHRGSDDLYGALNLRTLPIKLEYDANFGEAPNNITEEAWDNLLPVQGGFFQHPEIAPARSDFAVFHQLHCLNGIRQSFWFTHDAVIQGQRLTETDFPEMISPRHMSHCIDLLRQSLMCQPDLTVEVKDKLGGVTGFGTVHQCKDWEQFMEWMEEWETYGQTEPYVVSKHHHHGHSLVGAR